MSKLNEYITSILNYVSDNPDISETELIRHVYLDLGQRFSFDIHFLPFGNSKQRQHIYHHCHSEKDLEQCMETNIVICKSVAHILEHVLKPFDIDISTVTDAEDYRRCPHVYNVINPKDGSQPYIIDLQEDMYNIQAHSFTKNFGLSVADEKTLVISRFEQEQTDRKSGYVTDQNYYTNDYLYLLKSDMGYFEKFSDRVKFVLENIEAYDHPNMQYTDRQWHHVRILEELFSDDEFNYISNDRKIRIIDCYKDINNIRKYINCISVQGEDGTQVYYWDNNEGTYCEIKLTDFAKAVQNGLVVHNCTIPGLNKALRDLKYDGNR